MIACVRRAQSVAAEGVNVRASVVIWRRLDGSGMEHCRFEESDGGTLIAGTVVQSASGVAWLIEYQVQCDEHWRTREVTVRTRTGTGERTLRIVADDRGRWSLDGQPRSDLQGCLDVDLGFSPSTNTLPIRRLRLEASRSAAIEAAWLSFPGLHLQRVEQRYTRVSERKYFYENVPTGFTAEIDVDERGVVVAYPPGWEQVG
jgi:hypothetical protein